jgi:hypothetical protein
VKPPEYQLEVTAEYAKQLREIEAGTGSLTRALHEGIYFILQRTPYEGWETSSGLWAIRRWALKPLLMVDVAYRVDEELKRVRLVGIRTVDTTTL